MTSRAYLRASRCIHGEELWEQTRLGPFVRATGLYNCRPDPEDGRIIPYTDVPDACVGCTLFRPRGQSTLEAWL